MIYFKKMSVIATIILTVMCLAKSSEIKVAAVEDLKELWYETHYYPMNPDSDEWLEYGLEDALDILNPPEELLHSFSTQKLAELMMDYPYLWVLTSYEFDKRDIFFGFIEYCDIYNELMSRDDGVSCLLKEYQKSDFNVNLYNEDPYMVWGYHPMANAEVFGYQFIVFNSSDFDEDEYELCYQVMREKIALYSALNDNDAKRYLSFVKEQPNSNYTITAEEVKERWYDTRYYPFYRKYEETPMYDIDPFILDVMNPPLDLLLSMSTEELAELMQEYPLMGQITTYFGTDGKLDYATFFSFVEANCDIFYELLRRVDGITCLLQEYRTHEYVETLNEGEYSVSVFKMNQMWLAELFGCQLIRYYAHHFTDNEYALASQIIGEKKEQYSQDYRLLYYLDLPEIEPPTGEEVSDIRTNYLRPEEIQEKEDKLAAALLQIQSMENSLPTVTPDTEENSLQTVTPGTEDSNTANQEENNECIVAEPDDETATESMGNESHQKVMILLGAIIGLVCVIGGFVLIRRRRKEK